MPVAPPRHAAAATRRAAAVLTSCLLALGPPGGPPLLARAPRARAPRLAPLASRSEVGSKGQRPPRRRGGPRRPRARRAKSAPSSSSRPRHATWRCIALRRRSRPSARRLHASVLQPHRLPRAPRCAAAARNAGRARRHCRYRRRARRRRPVAPRRHGAAMSSEVRPRAPEHAVAHLGKVEAAHRPSSRSRRRRRARAATEASRPRRRARRLFGRRVFWSPPAAAGRTSASASCRQIVLHRRLPPPTARLSGRCAHRDAVAAAWRAARRTRSSAQLDIFFSGAPRARALSPRDDLARDGRALSRPPAGRKRHADGDRIAPAKPHRCAAAYSRAPTRPQAVARRAHGRAAYALGPSGARPFVTLGDADGAGRGQSPARLEPPTVSSWPPRRARRRGGAPWQAAARSSQKISKILVLVLVPFQPAGRAADLALVGGSAATAPRHGDREVLRGGGACGAGGGAGTSGGEGGVLAFGGVEGEACKNRRRSTRVVDCAGARAGAHSAAARRPSARRGGRQPPRRAPMAVIAPRRGHSSEPARSAYGARVGEQAAAHARCLTSYERRLRRHRVAAQGRGLAPHGLSLEAAI